MPTNKADDNPRQILKNGYQPKACITKVIHGQAVEIPISQLNLIPPKGGTAVVSSKKK
jgi:hypothetical protein